MTLQTSAQNPHFITSLTDIFIAYQDFALFFLSQAEESHKPSNELPSH